MQESEARAAPLAGYNSRRYPAERSNSLPSLVTFVIWSHPP